MCTGAQAAPRRSACRPAAVHKRAPARHPGPHDVQPGATGLRWAAPAWDGRRSCSLSRLPSPQSWLQRPLDQASVWASAHTQRPAAGDGLHQWHAPGAAEPGVQAVAHSLLRGHQRPHGAEPPSLRLILGCPVARPAEFTGSCCVAAVLLPPPHAAQGHSWLRRGCARCCTGWRPP